MTKSKPNPKVDLHLRKAPTWQREMAALRKILLSFPLIEEFKWAKPCYTFQGSNVVLLVALKESCTLGFMKGSLLKDEKKVLIQPGENSQSMRWFKFTSVGEIAKMAPTIKAYLHEAIENEKAGLKVVFKEKHDLVHPAELTSKLKENPALKTAFAALTPGRQRGYILYFSAAKQSATRTARIEKYLPRILQGRGMQDR